MSWFFLILVLMTTLATSSPFAFIAVRTTWKRLLTDVSPYGPYSEGKNHDMDVKFFVGRSDNVDVNKKALFENYTVELRQTEDHLILSQKNNLIWNYMLKSIPASTKWLVLCDFDTYINFSLLKVGLNMYNPDEPYHFLFTPLNTTTHAQRSRFEAITRGSIKKLSFARMLLNVKRVGLSVALSSAGVNLTIAVPDIEKKFVFLDIPSNGIAPTSSSVTDAILHTASIIFPINSSAGKIELLLKANELKRSKFTGVPVYWCDGGIKPQRRVHIEALLSGLQNVHRVSGPSSRDIAELRDRFPSVYKNLSHWCNYAWQAKEGNDLAALKSNNGELGCSLSHLRAIKTAYDDGYPFALILEDDISFETLQYWKRSLLSMIEKLPPLWDHLQLTVHATRQVYTQLRLRWGREKRPLFLPTRSNLTNQTSTNSPPVYHSTGAYVLSRRGMEGG